MKKYSASPTGKINKTYNTEKVHYYRYADDFIVTAKSRNTLEDIKCLLDEFLEKRGLKLSEEKTIITHIRAGIDFLGWNFRKYGTKLIIKPSKKSQKSIHDKVRNTIKKLRGASQDELIRTLNPIIRGWCNYHRNQAAKKSFQTFDSVLFKSLWKWAIKRHSNKSRTWIAGRYWKSEGSRNWIFQGEKYRLVRASDTKIRRHIKIKIDKNPYDKKDVVYFTKREESPKVLYSR